MGSLNQFDISEKWCLSDQVFLDVRSAGEFQQGHLPNSINVPILNDEERARVGTVYKQKGLDEAVKLGHEIVSGENRFQKVEAWKNIAQKYRDVILTCFRGGQRSQIAQKWLCEAGYDRPLVCGGYKAARQFLIDKITTASSRFNFLLISGPTGAGKTLFLSQAKKFRPTIDLEAYAEHRGSAFGSFGRPQPSQAVFENRLAWDLIKAEESLVESKLPLIMEDESRLIGRCHVPDLFFAKLRESPVVWLDIPLEERVENTFDEYILNADLSEELFARYKKALVNIQRRLGGTRFQEVLKVFESCEAAWKSRGEVEENKVWIQLLLVYYYDPLYFGSLEKRQPSVLFKGNCEETLDFLKGQNKSPKEKTVNRNATPT